MIRFLLWWGLLAGLFMLFAGEWTAVDWAAAGAAGVLAAGLTALMRRNGLLRHVGELSWLAQVPTVSVRIVVDFGVVTAALARAVARGRRESGSFVAGRDVTVSGEGPVAVGRRAWAGMAGSWAPNGYVVAIDAETSVRLSHHLVPPGAAESAV